MDDTTPVNRTTQLYTSADAALTAVLDTVIARQWPQGTPCEGWTVRDVVAHLIETQRQFLAGRAIAVGPAPVPDADPAAAWRRHADAVLAVLADDEVVGAHYDGHFGTTTVGSTIEMFYVFDMVVHRWDVATALGVDAAFTEAEMDAITHGADTFGDALYMDGVCTPGVEAPAGAGRQARILARLGRRA